jgi:hypothetical protein
VVVSLVVVSLVVVSLAVVSLVVWWVIGVLWMLELT